MSLWKLITGEFTNGFDYQGHYQSVEEGDIGADNFGFEFDDDRDEMEEDAMHNYWPEKVDGDGVGAYEVRKGRGRRRSGKLEGFLE